MERNKPASGNNMSGEYGVLARNPKIDSPINEICGSNTDEEPTLTLLNYGEIEKDWQRIVSKQTHMGCS